MNCPVCENPIEPRTIVACKRCFALFPGRDQQRIRQMVVRARGGKGGLGADYRGIVARCVRQTRERHPETRPGSFVSAGSVAIDLEAAVSEIKFPIRVIES